VFQAYFVWNEEGLVTWIVAKKDAIKVPLLALQNRLAPTREAWKFIGVVNAQP